MELHSLTLEELKNEILTKKLSKHFLVFQYEENKFLCKQYINAIGNILGLDILYISCLEECLPSDLFEEPKNYLYVWDEEKVDSDLLKDFNFQAILDKKINLIIMCNKIVNGNNCIGNSLETLNFNTVVFPKLLEWQVIDYLSQICKISEDKLKWLYEVTKGDIYRLDNEIQKLSIFETFEQDNLFNQINSENGYNDLNSYNIFNLTNALLKRDHNATKEVLHDIEYIDVEPVGLVTIMLKNIKNVIDIQLDSTATPDKLGMQQKQFNAIRYNCGKYNSSQLINIYKFLLDIDYNLKSGNLQFTDKQFIDYLVCNILNGGIQ